jgi:hypothetical protein
MEHGVMENYTGGYMQMPQWTIGPITLGSQQSWPVTPQTITPGGGGGGGGTFTPFTPQTLTPITTPGTFTPITGGGTFTPITGGGAAPQWTIGPITLGSQQSWPVSAHTITSGWSGPGTLPVTPIGTIPFPPTQQTIPPITIRTQF